METKQLSIQAAFLATPGLETITAFTYPMLLPYTYTYPSAVLNIVPSTKTTPKGNWNTAQNRKKSNLLRTLEFQKDKDFVYSPLYPHNLES